jgi:hypothetical protein
LGGVVKDGKLREELVPTSRVPTKGEEGICGALREGERNLLQFNTTL